MQQLAGNGMFHLKVKEKRIPESSLIKIYTDAIHTFSAYSRGHFCWKKNKSLFLGFWE
jgi:hypothetical protein